MDISPWANPTITKLDKLSSGDYRGCKNSLICWLFLFNALKTLIIEDDHFLISIDAQIMIAFFHIDRK